MKKYVYKIGEINNNRILISHIFEQKKSFPHNSKVVVYAQSEKLAKTSWGRKKYNAYQVGIGNIVKAENPANIAIELNSIENTHLKKGDTIIIKASPLIKESK